MSSGSPESGCWIQLLLTVRCTHAEKPLTALYILLYDLVITKILPCVGDIYVANMHTTPGPTSHSTTCYIVALRNMLVLAPLSFVSTCKTIVMQTLYNTEL